MKKNRNSSEHRQNRTLTNSKADEGLAITQEQVSDMWAEGTYDAKIDEVDENGNLLSHEGEAIRRNRGKGHQNG
ncbi:YozQ family protein [Halobacillus litoralis]|uniref:YozQ family protein n=1 Tax=Halobacillus litoralis TaxID=45668 RepID=UPI001CFE67E0|nr:YozQ family protein [Halobacillus litoralis]